MAAEEGFGIGRTSAWPRLALLATIALLTASVPPAAVAAPAAPPSAPPTGPSPVSGPPLGDVTFVDITPDNVGPYPGQPAVGIPDCPAPCVHSGQLRVLVAGAEARLWATADLGSRRL